MLIFKFYKVVICNDSLKFSEVCVETLKAPQVLCSCYLILWEEY